MILFINTLKYINTFTSPDFPHTFSSMKFCSALLSLNSAKISLSGFWKTKPKVFRRPRWAIPNTRWLHFSSPAHSTSVFKAGIVISQPSIPNLFEVGNLLFKNKLKLSFSHKLLKIFCFYSLEVVLKSSYSILSNKKFFSS